MKSIPKTNKSDKSPAKAPEPKVAKPIVAAPVAPKAALTPKAAQVTPVAAPVIPPATTPKAAQVAPLASIPTPSEVDAVAAPIALVTGLAIASIRLDGGTQSRASLSTTTIAEYAEA